MRWPFRRSQPEASRPAERGASSPAAPVAAGAGAARPAPRGEWATVASLQPTITPAPLVAPSKPFVDETHGARSLVLPRPMLAGRRDLEPPPGIVDGLAVWTGDFQSTTGLEHLPKLATAAPTLERDAEPGATAPPPRPEEPVAYQASVPLLPVAPPPALEAATPLVRSDLVLLPRPLVPPAPSDGAAEARAVEVPTGRRPRTVSRLPSTPAPAEEAEPLEGLEQPPLVQARRRPSVGQSRRSGIGPPIPVPPPREEREPEARPSLELPPAPIAEAAPPITPDVLTPPLEEEPPPPPPRTPPTVPRRRSRLGAPLSPEEVERAHAEAPPPIPRPAVAPQPPFEVPRGRAPVLEPVPAPIRDAVQRRTGVDVGDVLVHRDERAAREARELSARAFTRDGEVSLPPERGSLQDRDVRALLAHELTHVAQQRHYGSGLPFEHAPLGRRLEAQARRVEREVRGDPEPAPIRVEPPPPPPPPAEPSTGPTDFVITQQAEAFRRVANELVSLGASIDADGAVVFDPTLVEDVDVPAPRPGADVGAPGVQRAELLDELEVMATSFVPGAERAVSDVEHEAAAAPAFAGAAVAALEQEAESLREQPMLSEFRPAEQLPIHEPSVTRGAEIAIGSPFVGGEEARALTAAEPSAALALTVAEPSASPALSVAEPSASSPSVPEEAGAPESPSAGGGMEVNEDLLFRQLYQRVRQQLRRDMLIERERSGSLANSH